MTTALAAIIARDFGTPSLIIDMDRVERNIARIQAVCDAAGVANRPHIKTHKCPMLARMQIAAGAKGITCQKLGEAEIMADAGIDDILISYNLIGDEKMARLAALQAKAKITVAADNATVVEGLKKAAALSGRPLDVVVECDTGRKRAGVETPAEAIELARLIDASEGLSFAGFMLYPTETGWTDAQKFFDEALAGVRALGLEPRIVSTGGTPNLKNVGALKGATEHRFGTYIYNDQLLIVTAAVIMMVITERFISKSRTGRGIRAVAQDPDTATLMGVNKEKIIITTFVIGGILAGAAALFYTMKIPSGVVYNGGFILGIKAFAAAVLGGIGNVRGALLGGLLLGLIGNYGQILLGNSQWTDVVAFMVLVLVLLFRPEGILGTSLGRSKA